MRAWRVAAWSFGAMCAGAAGCSGTAGDVGPPAAAPTAAAAGQVGRPTGCARRNPGAGPARDTTGAAQREGSSVALVRQGEALFAYVADPDVRSVHVVDPIRRAVLASTEVSGQPEQLLVLPDGRVVVSLSDKSKLEILEPTGRPDASLAYLCAKEVPAGPFGLALSEDDATLAVTSTAESAVSLLRADTLDLAGAAVVARSPRGVLFARDRVFVSHVAGAHLSVVDPADPARPPERVDLSLRVGSPGSAVEDLVKQREASQAYALASVTTTPGGGGEAPTTVEGRAAGIPSAKGPTKGPRVVVPMVSVDPGDRSTRTQFYYGPPPTRGVPKQAPVVTLVDPETRKSLSSHVLASTGAPRQGECNLPRAVAFRRSTEKLYVACRGVDRLLELDARAADPMRAIVRSWEVPAGPSGVAIAEREGLAVVYGAFGGQLAAVALDGGEDRTTDLDAALPKLDTALHLGRSLFYRSNDRRITADGIACASCHPDGADDGITWSTPEGPRQTLLLAGRVASSAPYGWSRNEPTLGAYIYDTSARLGGGRLHQEEIDALAKYLESMPAPPRRAVPESAVAHGMRVFLDKGCGDCHVGGTGSDNRGHDLDAAPADAGAPRRTHFDTPSLRSVSLSGPYFHDGRYRSLTELLADPNSRMGATASLTGEERVAVQAFLEAL